MPIEVSIKQGDAAAKANDFLTAISKYTEALGENPQAFAPLIKRAQTYTKLCDYDSAKADISKAFTISEQRGKMADKATCYFRLGVVNYSEKHYVQAYTNFQWAKTLKSSEPALDIWIEKARRDCVKHGLDNGNTAGDGGSDSGIGSCSDFGQDTTSDQSSGQSSGQSLGQSSGQNSGQSSGQISGPSLGPTFVSDTISEPTSVPTSEPTSTATSVSASAPGSVSASVEALNRQAPIKPKIRDEWYQSKDRVTITIYASNIASEAVHVTFTSRSVSVSFPTSENSEYNYSLDRLAGDILPDKSSYTVMTKKIEIVLIKAVATKWSCLEAQEMVSAMTSETGSVPEYPSSSRKKTDWAKFDVQEEETDGNPEDFFAKLYKDVDEDTRRAMMKSYVESNGTVLTTNWKEAKDKKFDTRPPDGMEARKW